MAEDRFNAHYRLDASFEELSVICLFYLIFRLKYSDLTPLVQVLTELLEFQRTCDGENGFESRQVIPLMNLLNFLKNLTGS